MQHRDNYNQYNAMQSQPQAHSFTFQSSTVSYGGANGSYYTSSKTRRMGSDGVSNCERFSIFFSFHSCRASNLRLLCEQLAFEESKEADTTSGQATHRVSKGLRNKVFFGCHLVFVADVSFIFWVRILDHQFHDVSRTLTFRILLLGPFNY